MFKHYGVQNGLSQSTVYTIMQDRTGFIWIGTKEGLNRFDGTSFKIYRAYNDEHSLQSDFITSLYEDVDGNIWVGTDIGVWIYNPMTDSFHHFNTKTAGGTLITNSVNVITGNNRYIYISANEQGVFRYDIKERSLTNNPLPGYSNVVGMSLGKDNRIWLGLFGDGLYSADLSLRNVQPFTAADGSHPFANDIVSSILPYSADRLYIGADRHGLCEVNTSTRQYNIIADRYDGKNIFVRMVAKKQNEIWAASEMGLYIYNVATRSVQHFMYNPADPFSLSDNPLYCLFQDRDGGMWAGSYFGGVNYLPNTNPLFERFVPQGNMHGRRVREMVPDRNGKMQDVVLGYDNIAQYADREHFGSDFGAAIGRYANRINQGRRTIDGKTIQLPQNNYGHCLHGGPTGWQYKVYDRRQLNDSTLQMCIFSPDGDNGFPGNVNATVTYTLTSDNSIDIRYEATSSKKTFINMTNHSYFNLNGNPSHDGENQMLYINADRYTPADTTYMTTGEELSVAGTPMDFRRLTPLSRDINNKLFDMTRNAGGFDHNWCLNTWRKGKGNDKLIAAALYSPATGIRMDVYTNEPGIQVYTGNFLDASFTAKHGYRYPRHSAVCLETQHYPDSPNKPQWPSALLEPGKKYTSHCRYHFSIGK